MSANTLTPNFPQEVEPTPPPAPPASSSSPAAPSVGAAMNDKAAPPRRTTAPPSVTMTQPQNQKSFLYNLLMGPGGAATMAGACEIIIFHPFDTTAKRLMSHHHRVVDPASVRQTARNFNHVVFGKLDARAAADPNFKITAWERVKFMYPGSTYAVAYKVLQRVVKFAGQPYCRDYLYRHHSNLFFKRSAETGEFVRGGKGSMMLEATAGCLVGISEVILLPFDRMKVLNQTNTGALQGRSMASVIGTEGIAKLYAGTLTTAVRNAPGSFLLFGGTAFTKEYVFGLENYHDATFAQNIIASTVGGSIGVICTSPMDVIKTRIQAQKLTDKLSGWQLFAKTVKEEGFSAFYKGITPKLITSAPRLVFSYTMTQYFTKMLRGTGSGTAEKRTSQP